MYDILLLVSNTKRGPIWLETYVYSHLNANLYKTPDEILAEVKEAFPEATRREIESNLEGFVNMGLASSRRKPLSVISEYCSLEVKPNKPGEARNLKFY